MRSSTAAGEGGRDTRGASVIGGCAIAAAVWLGLVLGGCARYADQRASYLTPRVVMPAIEAGRGPARVAEAE